MVPSQSETPAPNDRTAADPTPDSAEGIRQPGDGKPDRESSPRRRMPWAYVLAALAVTFFLLHFWVLDGPKGPKGEDLRENRVVRGFQGVLQVDRPYQVARFTYSLIAHAMIIIATWYFSRGWHGLLVFLLVQQGDSDGVGSTSDVDVDVLHESGSNQEDDSLCTICTDAESLTIAVVALVPNALSYGARSCME